MKPQLTGKALVAAGHLLAKQIGPNTPLKDISALISSLATHLDVALVRGDQFKQQVNQLAAENMNLKSWADIRARSDDALEQEGYSTLKIDWRQRSLSDLKTPHTDSFLLNAQADGVDKACIDLRELAIRSEIESPISASAIQSASTYLKLKSAGLRAQATALQQKDEGHA